MSVSFRTRVLGTIQYNEIYLLDFYFLNGLQMGVEYSSSKVQISDWKTLAADSYYKVRSRFDLRYHMAIFD